ncbi:MAG: hypothetical protein CM1200mP20_02680 [Pseudomonadota bacterium]|nr:MAG: hypothetical protein CM1200mP20_02680 [Pseudomonadota bacterium]
MKAKVNCRSRQRTGRTLFWEIESKIAALPFWSGPVTLEPLSGGPEQPEFRGEGPVRDLRCPLWARHSVHHVIRSREAELSRAAAELEISPRMHWAQDGVMIFDFFEGLTYGPADLEANIDKAVALVKRCHRELHRGCVDRVICSGFFMPS